MVKSVFGSFIINCDINSEHGREINKSTPTYDEKEVVVLQAKCYPYDDGKEWLHISVSRKSRLPTYEEMTRIKRDFIGDDKKAISVLPEKKYHVNIDKYCLHLFYSAENPLPEFSGGTGCI